MACVDDAEQVVAMTNERLDALGGVEGADRVLVDLAQRKGSALLRMGAEHSGVGRAAGSAGRPAR